MKSLLMIGLLALTSLSFADIPDPACGDGSYTGAKFCTTNGECMDHCGAMSTEFSPIHAALVPSASGGLECGCVPGLSGGLNERIKEKRESEVRYW